MAKMQSSLRRLTYEIVPNKEVPHRWNEMTVKCYGSKHAGKTNCAVQMKHVIGQLEEVTMRFNPKRYHAMVTNLLDCIPPKKKRSKLQKPMRGKEEK